MSSAGFKDYTAFIRAVYGEIQKHADANDWLPVYYNLGDEPLGDELVRSAENAEAYRRAFPRGRLISRRPAVSPATTAKIPICDWARPCIWSVGTCTMKPP